MKSTRHTPKRNVAKAITVATCVFGGLVFLSLALIEVIDSQNGYSIDPTDPSNFLTVKITNDSPNTERIAWVNTCVGFDKDKCAHAWTIAPGAAVQDSDPRGGTEQYRVSSNDGKLLGCLVITRSQSQTRGVLNLNTAQTTKCN